MFVQNDEMLIQDEVFRNIVRSDNAIRQSGSPDIISCLSNNTEYSLDISLVYCTMIAINNLSANDDNVHPVITNDDSVHPVIPMVE